MFIRFHWKGFFTPLHYLHYAVTIIGYISFFLSRRKQNAANLLGNLSNNRFVRFFTQKQIFLFVNYNQPHWWI